MNYRKHYSIGTLINSSYFKAVACFCKIKNTVVIMTYIVLLGIAHRDLKPDNILCVHSDRLVPVKLIDFDLASSFMLDGNGSDVVTTPRLRSPVSGHMH